MRERALFGNQLLNRWTARVALKFAGLLVQPSQSAEFFILSKLRLPDGRLQHVDRLVIDLERHREWIPVLPTMRERKSRRVTETTWGSMQDFGHHRQSLHGPRAYARRQQEFGKIRRPTVGSRCQIS